MIRAEGKLTAETSNDFFVERLARLEMNRNTVRRRAGSICAKGRTQETLGG